jgi:transforming growth factor-beta-induced protein
MKRTVLFPLFLALSILLAACAPQATPEPMVEPTAVPTAVPTPTPAPQTIVDIAVADGRFGTLVAAVTAAGLAETLSGEGPFTVFAPTDDAFAKLPAGTVEALLADIPALTDILLYHVVDGKQMAADVVAKESLTTLQGKDAQITVDGSTVKINDATIVLTDIEASNGVIHVIDTVILPPADQAPQTIVDIAVADGRFGTLVAAVTAAGLAETLSGEGPFTVFAPTDDAFAKLPAGTVEALLADIPALTDILLYHVVDGKQMAADVVAKESLTTLQGKDAKITVDGNTVKINDATIILTDIEASNGVIHVIDTVILPPADEAKQTIVDIAAADPQFSTLVEALTEAGLVKTLSGEGPFTVFAPTNDAFAKTTLPADLLLADILLYHVVSGNVLAADVVNLPYADTVLGQPVFVKVDGMDVMINQAKVVVTDIQASNGVIHVIDTVLLPPTADIVDTAIADGRFTTLVAAVQAAGLVDALKGEGPLTVFAPTDDAFAKLPAGTIDALLADIPTLTDILLYHVVEGRVLSADVLMLESAVTLQSGEITISIVDGKVMINDAMVIITDILTTNGVIHVIDTVILPPAE